jgi:hypothetical protein
MSNDFKESHKIMTFDEIGLIDSEFNKIKHAQIDKDILVSAFGILKKIADQQGYSVLQMFSQNGGYVVFEKKRQITLPKSSTKTPDL